MISVTETERVLLQKLAESTTTGGASGLVHHNQAAAVVAGSHSYHHQQHHQMKIPKMYRDHYNDPIHSDNKDSSNSNFVLGSSSSSSSSSDSNSSILLMKNSKSHNCKNSKVSSTSKKRERGQKKGASKSFPVKLHEMLSQVTDEGLEDVISWQPHGRSFVIHKPKQFVEDVMPRYFKQTKLASFQRQLNLYDFSRLSAGPDRGGYYHELFLRGRPDLCKRILRRAIKGTNNHMLALAAEPNFYKDSSSSSPSSVEVMGDHPAAAPLCTKSMTNTNNMVEGLSNSCTSSSCSTTTATTSSSSSACEQQQNTMQTAAIGASSQFVDLVDCWENLIVGSQQNRQKTIVNNTASCTTTDLNPMEPTPIKEEPSSSLCINTNNIAQQQQQQSASSSCYNPQQQQQLMIQQQLSQQMNAANTNYLLDLLRSNNLL